MHRVIIALGRIIILSVIDKTAIKILVGKQSLC